MKKIISITLSVILVCGMALSVGASDFLDKYVNKKTVCEPSFTVPFSDKYLTEPYFDNSGAITETENESGIMPKNIDLSEDLTLVPGATKTYTFDFAGWWGQSDHSKIYTNSFLNKVLNTTIKAKT